MRPSVLSLVLLIGVAPGCAMIRDRGYDLAQTIDVAAGYSEGLSASARVTKLIQFGFGGYRGIYWGGLKQGTLGLWEEERTEFGLGPFFVHELFRGDGGCLLDVRHPLFGDPGFRQVSWDVTHYADRGWFDIGATGNLVLVGVDVAIRPIEVFDFLAGFVGFDPLLDDVLSVDSTELQARLMSDDASVRAGAVRALRIRTGEEFGYRIYTAPRQMPEEQIEAVARWREWLAAPPFDAVRDE